MTEFQKAKIEPEINKLASAIHYCEEQAKYEQSRGNVREANRLIRTMMAQAMRLGGIEYVIRQMGFRIEKHDDRLTICI